MWFQLKVEQCPSNEVEDLCEELQELGALSLMLTDKNDNPVLEPEPGTTPLWPEVIIHALYAQAEEAQRTKHYLHQTMPTLHSSIEVLEDKDWERAWMDDFKPTRFGERLWVCPSWLKAPDPQAVTLLLDPGLAFGTGTHPTTALCLTWLDKADLDQKTIIDYGCGSGILSLAAIKLGARIAYAIDLDPQALLATQNNAKANAIDEQQLVVSTPTSLDVAPDLIVANILLAPLIKLKDTFHAYLSKGSLLVTSGILNEQEDLLIAQYNNAFELYERQQKDGWSLLVFKRI